MVRSGSAGIAVAVVAVSAVALAVAVDRFAPAPDANVARGSEEVFASGLHYRELPPRHLPIRWTKSRAFVHFRDVPQGPATLEVNVVAHRSLVVIAADGVILGTLAPGSQSARFSTTVRSDRLEVELRTDGFETVGGRHLGLRLNSVRLVHVRRSVPSLRLLLVFLFPALLLWLLARACSLQLVWASILAIAISLVQAGAVWPCGVVRSGYADRLAFELVGGGMVAAAFGFWMRRTRQSRASDAGASDQPGVLVAAFLAVLSAVIVQGIAGTSPVMVVSDVVFHANKLIAVLNGNLFPTSFTQHARPFRIPYGAAFYALLAPLVDAGFDPVALVRAGAGLAGVAASAALFAMLIQHRPPAHAALAVVLLQLQPAVFDVLSYGNLSNAFGQAVSLTFFAWWAGSAPGGALVGVLLAAFAGWSHLSSFVVLGALIVALVLARGRAVLNDRPRLVAAVLGLGLAGLYYVSYARLIADQIPRLLEGGGQGRGAAQGLMGALRVQVINASAWGLPAMILAVLGAPKPRRSRLERDLAAYAIGVSLLFLPALFTPLDVRYLYALTPVVAVAAADGWARLASGRRFVRAVAWALLAGQALLAARNLVEAVFFRYR